MAKGAEEISGIGSFKYLIIRPEAAGIGDLWRFMTRGGGGGRGVVKFLESSDDKVTINGGMTADHRWVIVVSVIIRKMISLFATPMELTGYLVDFVLNLLSLNGNLVGLFFNFLQGKLVIPQRESETFISTIGHLDGRIDLHKSEHFSHENGESSFTKAEAAMRIQMGNKTLQILCILASKLAYENASVVENVVVNHWKMHFVGFYNCWNAYQKERSTQVFILCDKSEDADVIIISFRGTEPFDANDWSTDFDYSWFEIPELGKFHLGFLEALGLGTRANAASFQYHLQQKDIKFASSEGTGSNAELTAYYAVRIKLNDLLAQNKNAKFIVTGHSLGGALAILFPTVLLLHEENEMMKRLLGIYTFGQPRIGDMKLGEFMEKQLNHPEPKYFRLVYCNDLVPRLPYDDKIFLFKHFGMCLYYDSLYLEQEMQEQPNKNYFGLKYLIPQHLNAVWELIRALTMGCTNGKDYVEGWFSILLRAVGLVMPGLSAHSPRDYVNSIRLGRERVA
ncbi:hypothetical protein Nepgr_017900 [Nepenthes gracilis]|uniref:Fungal lipase-type domain-containing protein n=1 Tax=Nepenthes gracilis TaxID=150966 RepID=A0AAD3SSI5_NEPGR|nr:hypothetical protein Nepgr_017900 [Nepenthes gracilis]